MPLIQGNSHQPLKPLVPAYSIPIQSPRAYSSESSKQKNNNRQDLMEPGYPRRAVIGWAGSSICGLSYVGRESL